MLLLFFDSADFLSNGISPFQQDPSRQTPLETSHKSVLILFFSLIHGSGALIFLVIARKIESWRYLVQELIEFIPLTCQNSLKTWKLFMGQAALILLPFWLKYGHTIPSEVYYIGNNESAIMMAKVMLQNLSPYANCPHSPNNLQITWRLFTGQTAGPLLHFCIICLQNNLSPTTPSPIGNNGRLMEGDGESVKEAAFIFTSFPFHNNQSV